MNGSPSPLQPVIYAPCPDINRPVGGIKQLYRHVDILNRNGIKASILHKAHGFRVTNFANTTEIGYCRRLIEELDPGERNCEKRPVRRFVRELIRPDVVLRKEDILLVPETYGPWIAGAANGVRKVIFNQSAHFTFAGQPLGGELLAIPYHSPDVLATVVVSDHALGYLRYAFPTHEIHRVHLGIDTALYAYQAEKKRQIAVMPRKLRSHVEQVLGLLKVRGSLDGFDVVIIENLPGERDVARVLGDSKIFLSFSEQEGFGLPPAEAMACGCVVVGYHGFGGREFFNEEYCYPVPEGDVIAFARTVERAIRDSSAAPAQFMAKGRAASEFIGRTYSMAREEEDIIATWRQLDARHGLKLAAPHAEC